MTDSSHLDNKYFIDPTKYNCPFCNRRHVSYTLQGWHKFNWTDNKPAFVYFVKCDSCSKESMHLSFKQFLDPKWNFGRFIAGDIDGVIFYSVPSSFHVIDTRIPGDIRELISEAEGCLKSNFLTGASACVRKAVYELAQREDATGDTYDERLKSLKQKLPAVDPTYFDTLLTIQQLTSDKVHEESYDGWEGKHLRLILATLLEAVREIYVVPALRAEKRSSILALKGQVFAEPKRSESLDAANLPGSAE